MTNLADLDRPVESFDYEPWDRKIKMRKIAAPELVSMHSDYAHIHGQDPDELDADELLRFYAEVLSLTVIEPAFSKEEWYEDATQETLNELGLKALRLNGLVAEEVKKKSNDPSGDSSPSSAERSASCTPTS